MLQLPSTSDRVGVKTYFDLTYNYINKILQKKHKSIANGLGISVSYLSNLRNDNSVLSSEIRHHYLIKLYSTYLVSVSTNENGVLYVKEHFNDDFLYIIITGYFYNVGAAELHRYDIKIDHIEKNIYAVDSQNKIVFTGQYFNLNDYSNFNLNKTAAYNRRSSANITKYLYEKYGEELINYECQVNGDIYKGNNEILFGYFTKMAVKKSTNAGRLVLVPYNITDLPSEVIQYLGNEDLHKFFDYNIDIKSIKDILPFLEKFNENNKNFQIQLPVELSGIYQQFFSFFSDFVKIIKGKDIGYDTLRTDNGLTFKIELKSDDVSMQEVEMYMQEYITFTQQNIEKLKINVETDISPSDFNIFLLDLKLQIHNLEQRLEIANVKNSHLKNENVVLERILDQVLSKETKIQLQLITGGEQQFADKIKN